MFAEYLHEKIVGLSTFGIATLVTTSSNSDVHEIIIHGTLNVCLALVTVTLVHFLKLILNKFTKNYK